MNFLIWGVFNSTEGWLLLDVFSLLNRENAFHLKKEQAYKIVKALNVCAYGRKKQHQGFAQG